MSEFHFAGKIGVDWIVVGKRNRKLGVKEKVKGEKEKETRDLSYFESKSFLAESDRSLELKFAVFVVVCYEEERDGQDFGLCRNPLFRNDTDTVDCGAS